MYTAIIPARPDEPYLLEALQSVLHQTSPPESVIVVINGTDDAEPAVSGSLLDRSPLVRVETIRLPSQPAALSRALDLVSTPVVACLDADDLWTPDKQETHLREMDEAPEADVVVGLTAEFTDNEAPMRTRQARARLFGACTFRLSAFDRFGPPDSTASHFSWSYRWWFHAQREGIRIRWRDEAALMRRVHGGNGWVTRHEEGRRTLLREIRSLHSGGRTMVDENLDG